MAHLNLRPGGTADLASGTAIGATTRAPSPVTPAPRQSAVTPQAAPEQAEPPISEILETLGFAFSAAGAGFQGKPIPVNPAVRRKEAELKQQRLDLEGQALRQRIFQTNLAKAQTFIKLSKDVPEKSKEKFKNLVAEAFGDDESNLGEILRIALDDESVGSVLEDAGLDPENPFIQSVVASQGSPEAAVKFLTTSQGVTLLQDQADEKFRPSIREKLLNLTQNIEENFDAKSIGRIKSLSSPGGKDVTVGEIMSLIPGIKNPENQFSKAERLVLERNPELLLEQGIVSDKEAAAAKRKREEDLFKAGLAKDDGKVKESTAEAARRIISQDLVRQLGKQGVVLTNEEIEGHAEDVRATRSTSKDAEGRSIDVLGQKIFSIVQQEAAKDAGTLVAFKGLTASEVGVATLLNVNPEDPSAKKIVQAANKRANKIGKDFETAKFRNAESALFEIEISLQGILKSDKDGRLIVGSADIPGFGAVAGTLAEIPIIGKLLSPEGKALRQQVQALANITLKDRSGAAVTTPEFERFKLEFGTGQLKNEAELLEGLRLARAGIERHKQNLLKGHDADAVRVYQSRVGSSNSEFNIFPETKFGDRGESVPAPKLGTPFKFDASKNLPDNATQEMIDERIKFLKSQGFK